MPEPTPMPDAIDRKKAQVATRPCYWEPSPVVPGCRGRSSRPGLPANRCRRRQPGSRGRHRWPVGRSRCRPGRRGRTPAPAACATAYREGVGAGSHRTGSRPRSSIRTRCRGAARQITVALDAGTRKSWRSSQLAARSGANEEPLAESLLAGALDNANPDPARVTELRTPDGGAGPLAGRPSLAIGTGSTQDLA